RMLDAKYVIENLAAVKRNCELRNVRVELDRIPDLFFRKKQIQQKIDQLKEKQNKGEKSALSEFNDSQKAVKNRYQEWWREFDALVGQMGPSKPTISFPSFKEWLKEKDQKLLQQVEKGKAFPEFDDCIQQNDPGLFDRMREKGTRLPTFKEWLK